MSRVGKQTITLPPQTSVAVGGDRVVLVKGPRGEVSRRFSPDVAVEVAGNEAHVRPLRESKQATALWGTFASHLSNMVRGVNEPFEKKLVVEGVGFRVEAAGKTLTLNLGFSHPVKVAVPDGIDVAVEKNLIAISGIDKEAVGQFAASVRAIKKPEPYKGKGIRYETEVVRRKEGKKTA